MIVTEFGMMVAKPDKDIMNEDTEEGRILAGVYRFVVAAPEGPARVSYGLEVENPLNVWGWFDWDSVEQHEKFAKKHGPEIVKDMPKILTHGVFTKHVTLKPAPALALRAPVTEVMYACFPADVSQTVKDENTARLQRFVENALDTCGDVQGVSHGWSVENDLPMLPESEDRKGFAVLTALVGWPSVDAHMKFRDTPEFRENVPLITEMPHLEKVTMVHVQCRTFERTN